MIYYRSKLWTLLKVLDPVCGSDAQTYGNLCILMQKRCTSKNNDLYVENPGVCEKPEPKNCGACAKTYGPVCGSGTILIFNNIFLINSLKIRKKFSALNPISSDFCSLCFHTILSLFQKNSNAKLFAESGDRIKFRG